MLPRSPDGRLYAYWYAYAEETNLCFALSPPPHHSVTIKTKKKKNHSVTIKKNKTKNHATRVGGHLEERHNKKKTTPLSLVNSPVTADLLLGIDLDVMYDEP